MALVCRECQKEIEYSIEPPRFCAWCGSRLSIPDVTAAYEGRRDISQAEPAYTVEKTSAPSVIGEYKIMRLLGAGGMGTVFEAESVSTGQRVAVKLLSSQFTTNPISVERFRQEGKLASQISHPRCVFVLAADTDQGRPYIVMELMPGETLKDVVDQQGPMSPTDAMTKILDVIDGLQEAHRLGVIHRDVKPSNCFTLPDGRVKVGDFGLSKSLSNDHQLTQTGAFLGTVLYASPEQIRGNDVGYPSDVYSVCATLYYLLTGRAPFEHESVTAVLALVISEDAPPIRSFRPELPVALERVIARGLNRDSGARYQTLEELRDAIAALIPNQLTFGGLWIRVGAYLVDEVVVRMLVTVPLLILLAGKIDADLIRFYSGLLALPLYFAVMEGYYGFSVGKRLFRLRVCRVGTTDPPGWGWGAVRTLVFYLLIGLTLIQPRLMIERIEENGVGLNILGAAIPFFIGLLVLIVPMRRSTDYRGLHEWLSGTCVLRLAPRPRPLRLIRRHPDRLGLLPRVQPPLPNSLGTFAIRLASPPSPQGDQILLGEDALLGRKVILHLTPAAPITNVSEDARRFQISRPTRLRTLAMGSVRLADRDYDWEAFVAPTGVPLIDVIDPAHPLSWAAARGIIEQLVDELAIAEADGTLPATLSIQQVWVELNGQLQLLDFIVPSTEGVPRGALPRSDERHAPCKLLAKVVTLALEGQPRDPTMEPGPLRAAVPQHLNAWLYDLLGTGAHYPTMAECRRVLTDTRFEPTEITPVHRAAQVGVQTGFLAFGLMVMFIVSGLFGFFVWLNRAEASRIAAGVVELQSTERGRALLLDFAPNYAKRLNDPAFMAKLEQQAQQDEERAKLEMERLQRGPKILALTVEKNVANQPHENAEILAWYFARLEKDSRIEPTLVDGLPFLRSHRQQTLGLILMWPLVWTITAYLFSGGFSYYLSRMVLRRTDGRTPTREVLALRALLIWSPVALLLSASVLFNIAILWWVALVGLIGYGLVVIASAQQAPHDRLLGLKMVPR